MSPSGCSVIASVLDTPSYVPASGQEPPDGPRMSDRPMAENSKGRSGGESESERERINRELIELLNELRVALPGVQVLFAFLLAVPFSNGWTKATTFQRDMFFATLICTT